MTPKEIDWVALRDKFFKECTLKDSVDGVKVRIDLAPHNLFEWFKKEILSENQGLRNPSKKEPLY